MSWRLTTEKGSLVVSFLAFILKSSFYEKPENAWLITGFVTRLTRHVSLVVQELLTLPEYLCSPPIFNGVRVTRSLVLYLCFVDRWLSFCTFSFGHCVVSSSINGFWLPLLYLQALLKTNEYKSDSLKTNIFINCIPKLFWPVLWNSSICRR